MRAMVRAFQAAAGEDYWEEYGISDEDAAKGIMAVLDAQGIAYVDDTGPTPEEIAIEESRKLKTEAEDRAWREANPEAAKQRDELRESMRKNSEMMRDMLMHNVLNTAFSTPLYSQIFPQEGEE